MRKALVGIVLLVYVLASGAQPIAPKDRAGIDAFNHKLEEATRRMDNTATLALWAEDGISLLPSTAPIVGKSAIAAFLDGVTRSIAGAHMQQFEMECSGLDLSSDLATEWCTEHQIVAMPDGKPPFDGRGKMLLVLRRASDGSWLLEREMWNQAEEK